MSQFTNCRISPAAFPHQVGYCTSPKKLRICRSVPLKMWQWTSIVNGELTGTPGGVARVHDLKMPMPWWQQPARKISAPATELAARKRRREKDDLNALIYCLAQNYL